MIVVSFSDDGNNEAGDGCSPTCELESGKWICSPGSTCIADLSNLTISVANSPSEPNASVSLTASLEDAAYKSPANDDRLWLTWDFGDGRVLNTSSALSVGAIQQQTQTHAFKQPNLYTASVSVVGGQASASIAVPIDSQISGLVATASRSPFCPSSFPVAVTEFGQPITFKASVTEGSRLTYSWRMGDETGTLEGDTQFDFTYPNPGVSS